MIPDGTLLASLRAARGRGRDDVPVHVAWGVLVLTIALRHTTIEACLGELRRNESLRKPIGIPSEEAVPQKWNLSRFLEALGQEPRLGHLHGMFDAMIERLGSAVPDLGRHAAGEATSLNARHKKPKRAEAEQEQRLPQASGGRKKYGRTVRVPREIDLRRFPAIPRATKKFERLYKGRTAVERVNAKLRIFWGPMTAT